MKIFFYTILFVFYVYVSQKKLNSFFANVCFDLRIADYDKILMQNFGHAIKNGHSITSSPPLATTFS